MKISTLRRCFYVTCVVVIACVLASAVIADVTAPPKSEPKTHARGGVFYEESYVLTCKGDIVVAYKNSEDEPFIRTTTALSSLPYSAQEELKKGIEVKTRKELNALIHEYCS
ncbi:MAG: hypothetical protein ACI4HJ_02605 [Ruminococcus sp.]